MKKGLDCLFICFGVLQPFQQVFSHILEVFCHILEFNECYCLCNGDFSMKPDNFYMGNFL